MDIQEGDLLWLLEVMGNVLVKASDCWAITTEAKGSRHGRGARGIVPPFPLRQTERNAKSDRSHCEEVLSLGYSPADACVYRPLLGLYTTASVLVTPTYGT